MANKYYRQNFNKAGGADTGRMGECKSKLAVAMDKAKKAMGKSVKGKNTLDTLQNIKGAISDRELDFLTNMLPKVKRTERAKGGRAALKRGGGKIPDYSGYGKITMRDILMGRGVIKKKKKKKMMAKKFKSPMEKAIKGKKA